MGASTLPLLEGGAYWGSAPPPLLEGGASWGSAPLLPEPEAPGVHSSSLAGLPASLAAPPAMELDWMLEVRRAGGPAGCGALGRRGPRRRRLP